MQPPAQTWRLLRRRVHRGMPHRLRTAPEPDSVGKRTRRAADLDIRKERRRAPAGVRRHGRRDRRRQVRLKPARRRTPRTGARVARPRPGPRPRERPQGRRLRRRDRPPSRPRAVPELRRGRVGHVPQRSVHRAWDQGNSWAHVRAVADRTRVRGVGAVITDALRFGEGSPLPGLLPDAGVRSAIAGFLFGTIGASIALRVRGAQLRARQHGQAAQGGREARPACYCTNGMLAASS